MVEDGTDPATGTVEDQVGTDQSSDDSGDDSGVIADETDDETDDGCPALPSEAGESE